MATVADILAAVDRLAPFALAESWDNVGLLLGDAAWPVRRVLVSLDVSEAASAEAERVGAEALLAHHPLFFKDIDRLTAETREGRLALGLLCGRRAVIAAHTNLDAAEGGLCDLLAAAVGLEAVRPLRPEPAAKRYKVVVFTPQQDLEAVQAAAFGAGAGRIGNYRECSFSGEGEGTFLPGEGAEPMVGAKGRRNTVPERRLEFVVDDARLGCVLAAVGRAHSYEEPAIDVYPLRVGTLRSGMGRVGRLPQATAAGEFARKVKAALGAGAVGFAGDARRLVERVAVVSGGGGGLAGAVAAADCQAFVTGELKHHEIEALAADGIAVILGGHYRTERAPLEAWARRLANEVDASVVMSEAECEPLRPL
jgi:dinuclear metal center YbgI/SA1388 family protein